MDDLVVILLTLVFIVAGLFGQIKKHRASAQNNAGEPSDDNPWELAEEDWQENPASRRKDETRKTAAEPGKRSFSDSESEEERITRRDLAEEEVVRQSKKSEKKKKFPLRKAVIYSEILSRKYV